MKKRKTTKTEDLNLMTDRVLKFFNEQPELQFKFKAIQEGLKVHDKTELGFLKQAVNNLTDKAILMKEEKGNYTLNPRKNRNSLPLDTLIIGTLDVTRSGMAYLIREDGKTPDIMIYESGLNGAINKDTVAVRVVQKRGGTKRLEGKVIQIVKRFTNRFVESLKPSPYKGEFIIEPAFLSFPIVIPADAILGASLDDKVVVDVVDWRKPPFTPPLGKVTKVLGKTGESNTEMHAILEQFALPYEFPEAVEAYANSIPFELPAEEIAQRKDCRGVLTFTIDPIDAKDFDDAISFQKLPNGNYEIGVHIADVSHYMPEGSVLDQEAYLRATSIYLADRVVPMLPERLSNGVCSLRPREDKFCFATLFEVNSEGKILSTWIGKTVIHSNHRFAYEEVQTILEEQTGLYYEELHLLDTFAKYHKAIRFQEGCIDFHSRELRFIFNEKGIPVDFVIKESKDAHQLIEEWMLLANKSVAEFVGKVKEDQTPEPFVYRIHDVPDEAKLAELATFAKTLGYSIDVRSKLNLSKSFSRALKSTSTTQKDILSHLAVRSMAKALYSSHNIGHYGLGFDYYSHFTSPIRRYPDVLAHRLLYQYLNGKKGLSEKELEDQCKHCSAQERLAVEAERASSKFMQVLYLEQFKGEVFEGVISGVKESGLFVELSANMCEGRISVLDLPRDNYVYDKGLIALVGVKTKRQFQLGGSVRVKILKTDLHRRTVDLILA